MEKIEDIIKEEYSKAVKEIYNSELNEKQIQIQNTRQEFEGDLTIVVFPILKLTKKSPEQTASEIGDFMQKSCSQIDSFNYVKGFLNISINNSYWINYLAEEIQSESFGIDKGRKNKKKIVIEYSSPNTNKPLHLGHIRNNLLGFAVSNILKANGHDVSKVNLVNDRGIHICKSMLAWKKFGYNETPESSGIKGDHLVGKYYVEFDKNYKKQVKELIDGGMNEDEAKENAPLLKEAREMLKKWENGDKETTELWKKMNNWVYEGFDITYKNLGVDFDKIYYESETYKLGRESVLDGLEKGLFKKKEDGSVWADLTEDGLDEKILLRKDGTSVYMTQDIGTASLRYRDFNMDEMVYVVGNEQNYHFQVLALIMQKLGFYWAKNLYHLSYGMVELPEGKMKSREGTVVDADDLMNEMTGTAKKMSEELGKLEGYAEEERENIYRIIGLGALKYFILKVDPKKNMTFDPKESIDFNGNTGPFIQYTYARINSVLNKAGKRVNIKETNIPDYELNDKEKELIKYLYRYPAVLNEAGENFNPGAVCNYIYDLVKMYNKFYTENSILKAENEKTINFRLLLSKSTSTVIKSGMNLIGLEVPDRM